jgi:polyphenol oxidase
MQEKENNVTRYKELYSVFDPFPELTYGLSLRNDGTMNRKAKNGSVCIGEVNQCVFLRKQGITRPHYTPKHVHGSTIITVTKNNVRPVRDADGCMTNEDYCLCATVADCVLGYAFEPHTSCIAIWHSGWKGTYTNITLQIIVSMLAMGARAENIRVALGPAIGACHYVIHPDRADLFKKQGYGEFLKLARDKEGYSSIDLRGIIREQCIQIGILENNIAISNYCTACMKDVLFSYWMDKTNPVQTMLGYMYLKRS